MRLGLVAPDWRVWFIASDSEDARRASLRQLVDALGIDWKLAGNLRQLVGLDEVGNDRMCRRAASGWHLLEDLQWVHDTASGRAIPLCGLCGWH